MFQASEGGSVSVGRRKFQSNTGATPTPAPLSKLEAAPRPVRGYGTDRISRIERIAGMTPISSPAVSSREVVLSKTSLVGICLITFACGIVTTVMVDRARSRTVDQLAAREPDPSFTRPTSAPTPIAPPPTATATATAASATASVAAAADPLVVQMPNLDEASKTRTIHAVPIAPLRPRLAETPVAAPKNKTPAAVAPSPVTIKVKPAVVAPVPVRAKTAVAAPVPVRAKTAVVATAVPLPTKTKTPPRPALAAAASKPAISAGSAPAKPKAASLKAGSPKAAIPKAAGPKKAKPATDSSDPANGWVDPFTL